MAVGRWHQAVRWHVAGGDSRSACAPRQQKAGRNSINFCPSYRCLCDWVVVWFGKGVGGAARGEVGGVGRVRWWGGIDWQHCVPLCGSFGLATSRAAGRKLNAFPTGRRRRDKGEEQEEQEERGRGGAGKGQEGAADAGHGGAVEAGEGMWMRMTSAAQAAHGGS